MAEQQLRLIEVRLSPACETKEDGFRSASPEVEGGCRAQLEKGGGVGGSLWLGETEKKGSKKRQRESNQVEVAVQLRV